MGNAVDVHIGTRLRMTREFRGVTQQDLAEALGLAVENLDQLERGVLRFAAPILLAASRRLGVRPTFFFDGLYGFERAGTEAGASGGERVASPKNDNRRKLDERSVRGPRLVIVAAKPPQEPRIENANSPRGSVPHFDAM